MKVQWINLQILFISIKTIFVTSKLIFLSSKIKDSLKNTKFNIEKLTKMKTVLLLSFFSSRELG